MNATAVKILPAPPDRIFEHWVVPELWQTWWTFPLDIIQIDPRVGGRFRVGTYNSGKGQVLIAVGEFEKIERPSTIIFSWSWQVPVGLADDTRVAVHLEDCDQGTQVTLTHSGFKSMELAKGHEAAWLAGLNQLATKLQ